MHRAKIDSPELEFPRPSLIHTSLSATGGGALKKRTKNGLRLANHHGLEVFDYRNQQHIYGRESGQNPGLEPRREMRGIKIFFLIGLRSFSK